ncbi:cytochrome c [Cytophagales bacterium RKSG123]|nr:cytochrome c [Xanthovirga aplysinae]
MFSAAVLASCTAGGDNQGTEYAPNMYHSLPYEPLSQITDESAGLWATSNESGVGEYYNSNPNNPHRMTMREPAPNTVSRNSLGFLPYDKVKGDIAWAEENLKNPLPASEEVISNGKELYDRFCQHCHGASGQGDGAVGKVLKGVPSYSKGRVKEVNEGHIFHVITSGYGRMGAHGSQLSQEERWEIVRYVQTLQNQ